TVEIASPPLPPPGEWWGPCPAAPREPAPAASAPCAAAPRPCDGGPPPCCQPRDECGWPVDACGRRYGRWELALEGGGSVFGSPDGILGEPLFIPGNQLTWNHVDYNISLAGRASLSYRSAPDTRWELRGTWYGNPDA